VRVSVGIGTRIHLTSMMSNYKPRFSRCLRNNIKISYIVLKNSIVLTCHCIIIKIKTTNYIKTNMILWYKKTTHTN